MMPEHNGVLFCAVELLVSSLSKTGAVILMCW